MKLNYRFLIIFSGLFFAPLLALAHQPSSMEVDSKNNKQWVLTDASYLERLGQNISIKTSYSGVSLVQADKTLLEEISKISHENGACAGYEVIEESEALLPAELLNSVDNLVLMQGAGSYNFNEPLPTYKERVNELLQNISEDELKKWVIWLSNFTTRSYKSSDNNKHVLQLKQKIEAWAASSQIEIEVQLVEHRKTTQKTLQVRIPGVNPDIVVLGAHLDSVNSSLWGAQEAPGADDNASGSANLLEVLRIIIQSQKSKPLNTIEFFWYAGEEGGLLGSSEIARAYAGQGRKVKSVLQLDMTLFPGSGDQVLTFMSDFTSVTLTNYFKVLNNLYLGYKVIDSRCGYGCSDHASWFRQGYSTVMPSEAAMNSINRNIHSAKDLINHQSSFSHSVTYAKLALAYVLHVAYDINLSED